MGQYQPIEVRAHRSDPWGGVGLFDLVDIYDGRARSVISGLECKEIESEAHILPSFATLTNHAAQILIDSLWEAGFRPTRSVEGSGGQIKALEDHIKSLRQVCKIEASD